MDQIIQKDYMSNIFRDVVFVLAAAPNRLSRDKIIFSENHISHILCLVLCDEDTEVASQKEGASKK